MHGREGCGNVVCTAGRGMKTWCAQLGGVQQCGTHSWEGCNDVACVAERGTVTWPVQLGGGAAMWCIWVQGHGEVGACQHCCSQYWGLVGP